MRQAVAAKGEDYEYVQPDGNGCYYTTPSGDPFKSQPSCIVGHALAYSGVGLDVLHAIDFGGVVRIDEDTQEEFEESSSLSDTTISNEDVIAWLARNGVEVTRDAIDLFRMAQDDQDNGMSWGFALDHVERA
jgi:hypothetical protein